MKNVIEGKIVVKDVASFIVFPLIAWTTYYISIVQSFTRKYIIRVAGCGFVAYYRKICFEIRRAHHEFQSQCVIVTDASFQSNSVV